MGSRGLLQPRQRGDLRRDQVRKPAGTPAALGSGHGPHDDRNHSTRHAPRPYPRSAHKRGAAQPLEALSACARRFDAATASRLTCSPRGSLHRPHRLRLDLRSARPAVWDPQVVPGDGEGADRAPRWRRRTQGARRAAPAEEAPRSARREPRVDRLLRRLRAQPTTQPTRRRPEPSTAGAGCAEPRLRAQATRGVSRDASPRPSHARALADRRGALGVARRRARRRSLHRRA